MIKEIMKTMNKLYRAHIETINIEDVKNLFGYDTEIIRRCFDYLGITYIKVADLWNVDVRYFTREEQQRIMMYYEIIA